MTKTLARQWLHFNKFQTTDGIVWTKGKTKYRFTAYSTIRKSTPLGINWEIPLRELNLIHNQLTIKL